MVAVELAFLIAATSISGVEPMGELRLFAAVCLLGSGAFGARCGWVMLGSFLLRASQQRLLLFGVVRGRVQKIQGDRGAERRLGLSVLNVKFS